MTSHQVLIQEPWDLDYMALAHALTPRNEWLPENVAVGCPGRGFVREAGGFGDDGENVEACVVCGVEALGAG